MKGIETVTVLADSREKNPLVFPTYLSIFGGGDPTKAPPDKARLRIITERTALQTADYALKDMPDGTLIERKGSLEEIFACCLTARDRSRFESQLDRLAAESKDPVLFLEGDPTHLRTSTKRSPHPDAAMDELLFLLRQRNIELLIAQTDTMARRRAAAELVLRRMLAYRRLVNA